jgi:hypothetical protein
LLRRQINQKNPDDEQALSDANEGMPNSLKSKLPFIDLEYYKLVDDKKEDIAVLADEQHDEFFNNVHQNDHHNLYRIPPIRHESNNSIYLFWVKQFWEWSEIVAMNSKTIRVCGAMNTFVEFDQVKNFHPGISTCLPIISFDWIEFDEFAVGSFEAINTDNFIGCRVNKSVNRKRFSFNMHSDEERLRVLKKRRLNDDEDEELPFDEYDHTDYGSDFDEHTDYGDFDDDFDGDKDEEVDGSGDGDEGTFND